MKKSRGGSPGSRPPRRAAAPRSSAGQKGYAPAQFLLARLYQEGRGVPLAFRSRLYRHSPRVPCPLGAGCPPKAAWWTRGGWSRATTPMWFNHSLGSTPIVRPMRIKVRNRRWADCSALINRARPGGSGPDAVGQGLIPAAAATASVAQKVVLPHFGGPTRRWRLGVGSSIPGSGLSGSGRSSSSLSMLPLIVRVTNSSSSRVTAKWAEFAAIADRFMTFLLSISHQSWAQGPGLRTAAGAPVMQGTIRKSTGGVSE